MPGQWARLSNISASGTWLKTESFSVGDTVITHTQGHSVGRILEAYRKLRASHPDLMSQVEIMSQPASNVDSVILAWCIEAQAEQYPATLWQRDCFSSVFPDTAAQSVYVAKQLSCLVAEKCTSKLQLTDTDFSKQFTANNPTPRGLRWPWQCLRGSSLVVWAHPLSRATELSFFGPCEQLFKLSRLRVWSPNQEAVPECTSEDRLISKVLFPHESLSCHH